jgi:uncharacterized membrane protein YphA (DoxX/SURF4 family)
MRVAEASARERLEATVVRYLPAVLRITVGLLWLSNVEWKRPPDFGESGNAGLFGFTVLGIEHPILPPYTWVLENVVLPNFTAFGWLTLTVETSLAAMLVSGTFTRFAALLGAAQSTVIGLTVGRGPEEWGWSYILMVAVHLGLLAMPAGRVWAVDSIRAQREKDTFPAAVRAGRRAMALAVAGYGVLVLILQADQPFFTAAGPPSGLSGVQGTPALGVLLLVVAGLLFAGAGRPVARPAGAVLLVLAAASLILYTAEANVVSAGPTTAAVLAAGAAFLMASATSRT